MATIREKIRDLSRQPHLVDCPVAFDGVAQVTPGFERVTLTGPGLAAYTKPLPADAFKLSIPAPDGASVLRAFTVRDFEPAAHRLTFDVARHDHGVATEWVRGARPGDELRLFGMRRDFALGDDVTRHLIIADHSALPAAATIVGSLPRGLKVTVVAATSTEADRALLPGRHDIDVRWVTGPASRGIGSPLERAVRELPRPHDGTQVWLAAESGVVRACRRYLLQECELGRMQVHAVAYWVDGVDSTRRDAEAEAVYLQAMREGRDVTDPVTQDAIEFADT